MAFVLGVHGWGYDPSKPAMHKDNPLCLFATWQGMLHPHRLVTWPWFSVPSGDFNLLKAWAQGRRGRYSWAWKRAEQEGRDMRWTYRGEAPLSMVCHSLGSRVVLESLSAHVERVDRVLVLNGAEHVSKALLSARANPQTKFLNIVVKGDNVLGIFGAWFSPELGRKDCIGEVGVKEPLANWADIELDDGYWKKWGREKGYDLKGDNPQGLGNHRYSYLWKGNHQLYRDFFDGKLDYLFEV